MMNPPNRTCSRCGTRLGPNEMFCSNCGQAYVQPAMTNPTQMASPPYGNPTYPQSSTPGQLPPNQYAPGPSTSPYGGSPYGNTAYGTSDPTYVTPPPPPPSYMPPPAPGPYGGNAGLYNQATQPAVGGFGQGSSQPQPPQQKRNLTIPLIITVVILLIALIGGGAYLYGKSKNGPSVNTATPTATTNPTTPPTTAPTTPPTPQALFSDTFADNSLGWTTGNNTGFSRQVGGNMLVMQETNSSKILVESLPTNMNFTDFSITVTATFQQADGNDGWGIYMRGDSNLDHDYRVDVYGDGTFAIVKEYLDASNAGKQKFLVNYTQTTALHAIGQPNTLTVTMKGTKLVYAINGTVVDTVTDSDYTSGQLALFASHGATSSGVKVAFTSVAVYPAP